MWYSNPEHPLRRLFAGLTEQTFMTTFGVADTHLTDYLSELLSRFVHIDAVYRLDVNEYLGAETLQLVVEHWSRPV